ncbi:MFS transporter [Actinocorallia herbida]|uniref:MFS transporter n=1 Tax=Actinocorallia herbida TaxID=58109 RepID=A0A3N1D1M5_9ACTN|nr:MFS transporter [Actinocorallia herbida]ROO87390.1 MFS transporter [Actinocorallia herbida]
MEKTAPAARSQLIVGTLAFAGIIGAIMQTIVVPFIGELPALLGTSASNASWVVTVTLLVGAVATPVSGRLGDLYGKKPLLLASTVPLIAGSVVCALSTALVPMVIGRGLQGLGVGIIPLGISILRDVMPPAKLGGSIALISASLGIGSALGLPLAAAVGEHADFHVLFWGTAALATLVLALIWWLIPSTPTTAQGRFDPIGALGLSAGLVCLLLGISKGAQWGWTSTATLGALAAALIILLAWGAFELRHPDPLVDLRSTARPQVLMTNIASVVVGFALYVQSLVAMQLLQLPAELGYGLGQSMLAAGLWMAPAGLVMMVVSPLGARLSAARGPKTTLAVGALVIAAAYGAHLTLMGSAPGVMIAACLCTTGVAFAYGAMPALIMDAVPQSETAAANSFNTLTRSIGTSASAAVIGVVLAQMTTTAGGRTLPSEAGFQTALAIGVGAGLLAALLTLAIPYRRAAPATEPAEHFTTAA